MMILGYLIPLSFMLSGLNLLVLSLRLNKICVKGAVGIPKAPEVLKRYRKGDRVPFDVSMHYKVVWISRVMLIIGLVSFVFG